MKTILKIGVLLISLFILSSCQATPEEISTLLPDIELSGDLFVTLEVGNAYTDPGATILGDFDLEIQTTSDLDVDTVGVYTITYSVEYLGITYSVDRTVTVVDSVLFNLDINISDVDITNTSISFTVSLNDPTGELSNVEVVLYQGSNVVKTFPITNGNTLITIDTFTANTQYRVVVEGNYLYGGITQEINGYEISFTSPNVNAVGETPVLVLNGEETITIFVYDSFTDPGATITNDFDLDISVSSDVDANTIGSYTITYSVTYEDVIYSVTRSVLVVEYVSVLDGFDFILTFIEATKDSITYTVNLTDPLDLLQDGSLSLYNESTLINSYSINNGFNTITFSNLDSDTTYEVKIEGSYDQYGSILSVEGFNEEVDTLPEVVLAFTNTNEVITDMLYSSVINVVDFNSSISQMTATLYQGDVEVAHMNLAIGDNAFEEDYLVSETTHSLIIDYTYTPVGSTTPISDTITLSTFTTLETPTPDLILFYCEPETEGFDCAIGLDTSKYTLTSVYVEVWLDGSYDSRFTAINNFTLIEITGLEDSTSYLIKLYADYTETSSGNEYIYKLIDEQTLSTIEVVSYALPQIENFNVESTIGDTNSITVTFDYSDPDNVLLENSFIRLFEGTSFKNSQLITLDANEIIFDSSIDSNTSYTIKIRASYKTSDNSEDDQWSEYIFEYSFTTQPDIAGISFEQEQEYYYFGDEIILILDIDNPEEMLIDYVTINGDTYDSYLFPSDFERLYISLGHETDYTTYSYHLESFSVTQADESIYDVMFDQTISFTLREPGSIDPENASVSILELTADDFTREISISDTTYYQIKVHLDNPYNLDVQSITINSIKYQKSQFVAQTTKEITLQVDLSTGYNQYTITDISYLRNDDLVEDVVLYIPEIIIYGYLSDNIVYINNAGELRAIDTTQTQAYDYYVLTDDIDLAGVDFTPIGTESFPFNGAFDGNGYTISNLYITSYEINQTSTDYFGLFGKTQAYIYNLNLENVYLNITTNENHTLFVGSLAGSSSGYIQDASVIGNSTITINGAVNTYAGGLIGDNRGTIINAHTNINILMDGYNHDDTEQSIIGGLVGISDYGNIAKSSATGSITITNTSQVTYHLGGLVGWFGNGSSAYSPRNNISNSFAHVNLSTPNTYYGSTGGLVGMTGNIYTTSGIINSYASGSVESSAGDIGGLVGHGYIYITNSFATGDVTSSNTSVGRIVGTGNNTYITNTFKYAGQSLISSNYPAANGNDTYSFTMVTADDEQFNDDEFYAKHLTWSTYFYNFDTLDVQNGVLPTLR
jgi:Bacterial surface protein, Ig-like domain/The GLUG motif